MGHSIPVTIEVLAPIWQRLLRRPEIGADDNFFDLGGDPVSAVQIFKEISAITGRYVPPVTIFQAPTLRSLVALLANWEGLRFPVSVLMKKGAAGPPVFVTHGLSSSIMELFDVVREIKSPRPFYGLQSKGFDGKDEPLDRVEDMAQRYLTAMKEVQPVGPYALIGYSFGGLVMMEIAQQLKDSGEKVSLLAMLESYPHRDYLPLKMRLVVYAGLARRHAVIWSQLPASKKFMYLTDRAARGRYAAWGDSGNEILKPETELTGVPVLERVRCCDYLALKRYRPRPYRGTINFMRSTTTSVVFPDDPEAVWAKWADKVEIETVPGDHLGIVATHYRELAAVLSRHLASAVSGN